MIEPRLQIDLEDFEFEGKQFSVLSVEPSYERPVRFSGFEFIRIGENRRPLSEFPEHERALWLATGRRRFESAIAASNISMEDILEKLDPTPLFDLAGEPRTTNILEIVRKMQSYGFLTDNMEGQYNITNLGAILLARDLKLFPSISGKSVRIVRYLGRDKSRSDYEQEGKKGYAVGFSGMIQFLLERLPKEEKYISGVRRMVPIYPETAIRELIANALIHQDFTFWRGTCCLNI
jgi:ATP-dependent DNA helicase RecG